MSTYSSVLVEGSVPRRSRWMDARNSLADYVSIVVPAGLAGTLSIEGTSDTSVVLAELATNPAYSDSSAASFSDVTSSCTFSGSLTVSGGERITGTFSGASTFVRVRWIQSSGAGTLVAVVSDTAGSQPTSPTVGNVSRGIRVEKFAPNETLTADNFDAALRGALGWCYAQLTSGSTWCYNVIVPAGEWNVLSPVNFPPTYPVIGGEVPTPGIVGAGSESTTLRVKFHNSDSQGGVFVTGNDTDYTLFQRFEGFALETDNGARVGNGIVQKASIQCRMIDVRVRGFAVSQHYRGGWGIMFKQPAGALVHQHPHLDDIASQNNMGGLWLSHVAEPVIKNPFLNQNQWMSLVYENVGGCIVGGTFQDADTSGPSSTGWWPGAQHPSISTGFDKTSGLQSGSSATCGAASFSGGWGTCTVTGLTGLTEADTNRWLELNLSGEDTWGDGRKISGIYQIVRVNSATSCDILKGSNHSSTPSVAWLVRGNQGGTALSIEGNPYHEGSKRCLVFHGPDETTASKLVVRNAVTLNLTTAIMADRLSGLEATGLYPVTNLYLRRMGVVKTDTLISAIDSDDFSRCSLTARKADVQVTGEATSTLFIPDRPAATTVADMLLEMGAAFLFDARRSDMLTLSTADITGATDLANGIALTPHNAGKYPTRVADAKLGHCYQILGSATAANVGALEGTIPANKLPSTEFKGTLVLIGRFSTDPARNSSVVVGSDVTRWWQLTMNNGGQSFAAVYGPGGLGGSPVFGQAWPANTNPFCIVLGGQVGYLNTTFGEIYNNVGLQQDLNTGTSGYPNFPGGQALTVRLGQGNLTTASSDFISVVAFLPNALSVAQVRRIMAAARVEFPELNN